MYFVHVNLKVITKMKQNLKLEKEFKIFEEVRTILFLTAGFDYISSYVRTTQTNHKYYFYFYTSRA